MAKNMILKGVGTEDAERLCSEIGKVRCWLTGFHAGRQVPGAMQIGVPGEDALRQMQVILKNAVESGK